MSDTSPASPLASHVTIAGRRIGPGEPAYVIAELSANHNRDFAEAERLVRLARDAGADAVKLQTYTPDTLTIECDAPAFRRISLLTAVLNVPLYAALAALLAVAFGLWVD